MYDVAKSFWWLVKKNHISVFQEHDIVQIINPSALTCLTIYVSLYVHHYDTSHFSARCFKSRGSCKTLAQWTWWMATRLPHHLSSGLWSISLKSSYWCLYEPLWIAHHYAGEGDSLLFNVNNSFHTMNIACVPRSVLEEFLPGLRFSLNCLNRSGPWKSKIETAIRTFCNTQINILIDPHNHIIAGEGRIFLSFHIK